MKNYETVSYENAKESLITNFEVVDGLIRLISVLDFCIDKKPDKEILKTAREILDLIIDQTIKLNEKEKVLKLFDYLKFISDERIKEAKQEQDSKIIIFNKDRKK